RSIAVTDLIREDVQRTTTWSIALSILMMAAGVLALLVPAFTGVAATLVVGWLLIFSGFLHLGFSWRSEKASAVAGAIAIGLVYGAIGFYLLTQPVLGLQALTFALAIYFLIEGILEFILSFQLRLLPGSGWLLFDGVLTVLLAVVIWSGWPTSSVWVVGT